ncbi:MAG TPA: hypothetical protein VF774_03035 [Pseudoduganella sp.]
MNDRISNASKIAATSLEGDVRWHLVQQVLRSPPFAKAPRMCGLLSFLMLRKLSGMEESINEHAIGIEVFRRDARDFDTTTDPIVRVQMGRLRGRLALYNATCAASAGQQIEIPAGSYVPLLNPRQCVRTVPHVAVQLAPLRRLGAPGGPEYFIEGLEEELALRLFQQFAGEPGASPHYRLEVSVRVEQRLARASIRLVDAPAARTVWMYQCDRQGELAIALQEALARGICDDLQGYLDGSSRSDPRPA